MPPASRDEAASGALGAALRGPQPLSTCARGPPPTSAQGCGAADALPSGAHARSPRARAARSRRVPGALMHALPSGARAWSPRARAARSGRVPEALVHALRALLLFAPAPSWRRELRGEAPGSRSQKLKALGTRSGRALRSCRQRACQAQAREQRGSSRSASLGEVPARKASEGAALSSLGETPNKYFSVGL